LERIAGKSSKKTISNEKDTTKNYDKDHRNSQNQIKDPKSTGTNTNPYDPENPRKESQSGPKDITGKDIEKDLIENDPLKGSKTDMDTRTSNEAQSDSFETIEADQCNPARKEFEIGQLRNDEIKNDELPRDESRHGALHKKPSQRNF
jgi:hypothetical protein